MHRLLRFSAVAVLSLSAAAGLVGCSGGGTAAVTTIGADQLVGVASQPGVVVLDVRTPAEFAEGHLPDAVNIDISDPTFTEQIDALPRDASYVVYCRSGNRSAQAAALMADAGFTDVYDVDAGLATLAEAGVPLQ
jgi:phage shock protein E